MSPNYLLPLRIRTSPPRATPCPLSPHSTTRVTVPRWSPWPSRTRCIYRATRHLTSVSPPRTHTQVVFADTSAPEDADLNRHKAYLAKENIEHSSARRSGQVKRRIRARSPVHGKTGRPGLSLFHLSLAPPILFHGGVFLLLRPLDDAVLLRDSRTVHR